MRCPELQWWPPPPSSGLVYPVFVPGADMTTRDNWTLVTIYPVSGSEGFKLNKDHLGAVWSGLASTEVWDTGIVGTVCHPEH